MMIVADLYYDQTVNYSTPLKDVFQALEDLVNAKGQPVISVTRLERGMLSEARMRKIADEIRTIKPQSRGAVVTSGSFNLPFSGSKKLNLSNTPILLVKSESEPLYVFPCRAGERYYDVVKGIKFLQDNLPDLVELPAETENAITSRIVERPELIEEGLTLLEREFETSMGIGDLLFKDKDGNLLLVEVERVATDQSVGQILRLCAGYETIHGMKLGTMRAALVCIRISKNVPAAAKRAGIEVRMIPKRKDGEQIQTAKYFSAC